MQDDISTYQVDGYNVSCHFVGGKDTIPLVLATPYGVVSGASALDLANQLAAGFMTTPLQLPTTAIAVKYLPAANN